MMTSDELYALGYALQTATWGVRVILEDPDHMNEDYDAIATWVVGFGEPLTTAEAEKRGWEAAQADFVKRRLDS